MFRMITWRIFSLQIAMYISKTDKETGLVIKGINCLKNLFALLQAKPIQNSQ